MARSLRSLSLRLKRGYTSQSLLGHDPQTEQLVAASKTAITQSRELLDRPYASVSSLRMWPFGIGVTKNRD